MKKDTTKLLLLAILLIAVVYSIFPSQSRISGSHTVYRARSTASQGDTAFCAKCHPNIAGNISQNHTYKAHGPFAGCICHGFYPNYTSFTGPDGINYNFSINLKHNLTKNVYCTNCHTRYNETGQIDIGNNSNAQNQSAHYIYLNDTNKTEIYERAYRYFNQTPFGPLE
jgi:cytochrome c553